MLSEYKPKIESKLQGLVRSLSFLNPNVLTLLGIIPPIAFFVLLDQREYFWAALALAFSAMDMLDGMVARTTGKVSRFGAFLDSTVDRGSDFLVIYAFYAAGLADLDLVLTLLVVSYLVSYVRSRAELASNGTIKFDQGLIERPERIIFLFIIVLLQGLVPEAMLLEMSLTELLLTVLTILSVITLAQRIRFAYLKLR